MEVAGLGASIITILQVATAITRYVVDVGRATKDQAQVAKEIGDQLAIINSFLLRLQDARNKESDFDRRKRIDSLIELLEQIETLLKELVPKVQHHSQGEKLKHILTWSRQKHNVNGLVQQIERYKTGMNLALSFDTK